jgi:galactonate dehydratase
MGGPHRERQWVYWSHLATYRANNWKLFGVKPLKSLQDLADAAREAPDRGYTVFKTNIIWPGDPARNITQGRLGPHDQVATRDIVKQAVAQIEAMREAIGPDVGICLDINVNFKPSEAIRVGRALEPYSGSRSTTRTRTRSPSSSRPCAPRFAQASSSRPCASTGRTSSSTRWTW